MMRGTNMLKYQLNGWTLWWVSAPTGKNLRCMLLSFLISLTFSISCAQNSYQPPNVILVIADDIGYGDHGFSGNDKIKTPHLDAFYKQSVRFTDFHVSPTCSPTRAALMTGRYNNRVGVWHTIMGRELLFADETILPQIFAENGYATAMFGKWHLGYAYPFRPIDRGFQEVVRISGGGTGQGPDYWGNDSFDDTYSHNGAYQKYHGFSTDVFFNQAIQFIEKNKNNPFFLYLATPTAHEPLNLPEKYFDLYKNDDELSEELKRFYGLITNIDDNFQRLENALEQLRLLENTIVIYMTDNGTGEHGFNDGLRGIKSSAYEGGHRVPFMIRWPGGGIGGGKDISQLSAHIDVLPTLVNLCRLHFVPNKPLDGESLVPVLKGKTPEWKDRVLVVNSQRSENLVKWRNTAVMQNNWRLVNRNELYNIADDPGQKNDISSKNPLVVAWLSTAYDKFWQSLVAEGINQRYAYIRVGTPYQNPARISAHDMHTALHELSWNQRGALLASGAPGTLKVEFVTPGKYQISLMRYPPESGLTFNAEVPAEEKHLQIQQPLPAARQVHLTEATLVVAGIHKTMPIGKDDQAVVFEVFVPAGKYDMQAVLMDKEGRHYPAYYTYVKKL